MMAAENNSNPAVSSNDDSYYETLASEEEIYLEETEEEIRSLLISDPQEGGSIETHHTAVDSHQTPKARPELRDLD